jgi:hypothetical protein
MTIDLQLDKDDTALLQQVLEAYLSELPFEIGDTDSSSVRSGLHEKEDRLKRILSMLDGAGGSGDIQASGNR